MSTPLANPRRTRIVEWPERRTDSGSERPAEPAEATKKDDLATR